MRISTLIVDDEAIARRRIRRLLKSEADIGIVGECENGRDAALAIDARKPALVFLDVQMPELDGFDVIRALRSPPPVIVFITAFDQYAVRAFEVHAVDYLLKPFDRTRLAAAVARARRELRHEADRRARLSALVAERDGGRPLERLAVKSIGRIAFVRTEEIDWIEAEGNYVRLHAGRETHLLRQTLRSLADRLDPSRFLRIHRGVVVNADRVRELQSSFHGEYVVILRDGTRLTASRTFNGAIQRVLRESR
jgi:two-component system LytT family response regulator